MSIIKIQSISLTIIVSLLLSGCVVTPDMLASSQACNANRSFSLGVNDGVAGKAMAMDFSYLCPTGTQDIMQKAYRDGYLEGKKRQKGRQDNVGEINGNINTGISININQGRHGNDNDLRPEINKNYYCDISAFGENFSAFGRTELETRQSVKSKCESTNGNGSIFCEVGKIECQNNK